jgi:ChrR Cupin-like domain
MTDQDDDIDAALFAVGLLSGRDHEAAKLRAARDEAFGTAVSDWDMRLLPLTSALEPLPPAPDLLMRIEARLDQIERPSLNCVVKRADEGKWLEIFPGVRIRVLHRRPEINQQTVLVEADPGAVGDLHDHDTDEECYVISGDISFGDAVLGPGDYHLAVRGAHHPPSRTVNGCLCLFIMPIQ